MRSEENGPGSPAVRASNPKPRTVRSRIAKPLLTSLGTTTMLAAGFLVVGAVSATGSVRPWDWTRADPSAAVARYELCRPQGPGAIGCMLSASFRPASAAPATHSANKTLQPLFSQATVQDPAPSAAPASNASRGPASGTGSTSSSHSGTTTANRAPSGACPVVPLDEQEDRCTASTHPRPGSGHGD
jgi:hypothetical protein